MGQDTLFTEFGIDFDNNKFGLGVSTEVEHPDGSEDRRPGFKKMHISSIYMRIWMFKKVLILSSSNFIELKSKPRNNFKIIIGLSGHPKN